MNNKSGGKLEKESCLYITLFFYYFRFSVNVQIKSDVDCHMLYLVIHHKDVDTLGDLCCLHNHCCEE